ncbi:MAG: DUF362 domain-containing protein [Terracidiphilus sp.]|jgi:uncharacterized protein (DUF362 family)
MKSRRDFLKNTTAGAVLLGSQSKLGLAAMLDQHKSKVVIARDAALHDASGQLDEKRVADLLDRAIAAYTGRDKPIEAWKRIVPVGKVIGLKMNSVGGKAIATHLALTLAICERLQQAGVKPNEIIIWECRNSDMERAGYAIATSRNGIRCIGNDTSGYGYEEQPVACGAVNVHLSKILTRECGFVINLPVPKDHDLAGVTFSMKNPYGAVERPYELHSNGCNPAVAELNAIPALREKFRFTIGDAISSIYQGGPQFRPEALWHPNALIVGEDPVALDYTVWQMIESKRAEMGLQTLAAVGRPTTFLATAAQPKYNLGSNDPNRIYRVEI